jgi:hypothetical protein
MDEKLQKTGTATRIEWFSDFECYLKYLLQGLRHRKASVLNIFKVWDDTLFPNTTDSLSGKPSQAITNEVSTRDVLALLSADSDVLEEDSTGGRAEDSTGGRAEDLAGGVEPGQPE